MRNKNIFIDISLIAIAAAIATPAAAQSTTGTLATQDAAAGPEGQDETQATPAAAGDIIVTARKREERLREVPVAITALGSEYLTEKNITQVVDLTVQVPNLTYSTASTQPALFIRGIGSGTNEGFDQSVGKFINNVYFGGAHDAKIPIFDIERIEVLKGPQVITFGNSSTAGALNITTVRPGNTFAANGSVTYDFVDREVKVQGGVTLPINEDASFRVAGYFQDLARGDNYNAFLDRHELQSRSYAIRPTLEIRPTSDLTITLMAEYDHFHSSGFVYQPIRQPLSPTAPRYPETSDPDRNDTNYDRAPIFQNPVFQQRGFVGLADIRWDILGGTATSTTAYRDQRNLVQTGLPGPNYNLTFFQHDLQRFNQFSQELRFDGTYGAFDLNLGAYYEKSNRHIDAPNTYLFNGFGVTTAAGTPTTRVLYYDQAYDKYSGVLETTYRIGGGFSVSGGVRYSRYEKDASQSAFGAEPVPNLGWSSDRAYINSFRSTAADARIPLFGATVHDFPFGTLKLREDHWQPQAIAQYKFGLNMLYFKYVKGDKAGGFDTAFGGTDPSGADFATEGAKSFELGFKGETSDRVLDYSIAAFRETFTDLQQSFLVGTAFVVTNAGEARSQGIELETNLRPAQGLRFSFNGAYLDAKFVDYPNAPCNTNQLLVQPSGCRQNRSGTVLQFASKFTGNLGVDYERPVGNHIASGGASVFYRSKFNAGGVNDPGAVQDGFAMIDAHLDFKPGDGRWKLSIFGRNLTDKRYLNYVVSPPGNSTALLSGFERGRQIGLQFEFKY